MAALSMVAVAQLAYDAGLRNPVKLAQAVAVATAESGRNPDAVGDRSLQDATWGPSIGLWQIRSLRADKGKGTIRDGDKLPDPAFNARSMVAISASGANWEPWTVTHVNNLVGYARYVAAMPQATAAASAVAGRAGGGAVVEGAGEVLQPVTQLAQTIADAVQTPARIANWLTESGTWLRLAYGVGGAVVVVLALNLVVRGK